MGISIGNNIASLKADRQINIKKSETDKSFERLSSGKRVNKAADDPAGLAVALDLLSRADTSVVAARNISDGVSIADIADGALSTAGDITSRLSELASQSANGTLSDTQRSALNKEYQALRSELDRISQTTEFNGVKLLSQDSSVSVQAGVDGSSNSQIAIGLTGVSSAGLGLTSDISTQAGALQALDQARTAVKTIADTRGDVGASVSRLSSAYENVKVENENNRASASRILDADVADEAAKLTASRIGLQSAVAVKAQANILPKLALNLLG